MIRRWLAHPLTRDLDLDAPETTELRKRIIREKAFLKRIYDEWYELLLGAEAAQPVDGLLLELGSGAGFLGERSGRVITSDVFHIGGIQLVLDGQALPFAAGSLKGILMVNVLHHIPQPGAFLGEASRCVKPGGLVAMIEPWLTTWSRFVYRYLHHEPLDADTLQWQIPQAGPLSGANSAMPWIIFWRDQARFAAEFPDWCLAEVWPIMPLRYLLAGGISMRSLMPTFSFGFWRLVERLLSPLRGGLGMFAKIVLIHQPKETHVG